MRFLKLTVVCLVIVFVTIGMLIGQPVKPTWGWKLATTPSDAHNFINGLAPYTKPHAVQTIAATNKGFYIFYRGDLKGRSNWGWKLANSTGDALNFLNRKGAYTGLPKAKAILAYKTNRMLYFFYSGRSAKASWGWKRSTSVKDMFNYLNGTGPYSGAKAGTIGGLSAREILMFYRGDIKARPGWGWKLATTIEDAYNFLNGKGAYKSPVRRARIFATDKGALYIFYRR